MTLVMLLKYLIICEVELVVARVPVEGGLSTLVPPTLAVKKARKAVGLLYVFVIGAMARVVAAEYPCRLSTLTDVKEDRGLIVIIYFLDDDEPVAPLTDPAAISAAFITL